MQSSPTGKLIGTSLDERYLVQELIGTGKNSAVYKAEDLQRKYSVAVKVLSGEALDEKSRERFQHGADITGSLAHPNIVRLYAFNVTKEGLRYCVMDCLKGLNLAQVLKQEGRLSEALCISIFAQVCDALEHAHAKGIVHRNLKPSNILLISAPGDSYMVKVADFGLAKLTGEKETRQNLANKGEQVGNANYMSPEQCTGGKIDGRADIYAAAGILYECLTGAPPYAGGNSYEVMTKHVSARMPVLNPETTEPETPSVSVPNLVHSRQLNRILERGLAKKAEERYQSAGEMSHDLNLINETAEAEWDEKAVAMHPVVQSVSRVIETVVEAPKVDVVKPLLMACAVTLLVVVVGAAALVALAFTDADIKPLLRYKIAVQEIVLPANDARLIRNLNYMTDNLKSEGRYADAWVYKEKVLKAEQPAQDPTH